MFCGKCGTMNSDEARCCKACGNILITPNTNSAVPNTYGAVPSTNSAVPNAYGAVPNAYGAVPSTNSAVPNAYGVASSTNSGSVNQGMASTNVNASEDMNKVYERWFVRNQRKLRFVIVLVMMMLISFPIHAIAKIAIGAIVVLGVSIMRVKSCNLQLGSSSKAMLEIGITVLFVVVLGSTYMVSVPVIYEKYGTKGAEDVYFKAAGAIACAQDYNESNGKETHNGTYYYLLGNNDNCLVYVKAAHEADFEKSFDYATVTNPVTIYGKIGKFKNKYSKVDDSIDIKDYEGLDLIDYDLKQRETKLADRCLFEKSFLGIAILCLMIVWIVTVIIDWRKYS